MTWISVSSQENTLLTVGWFSGLEKFFDADVGGLGCFEFEQIARAERKQTGNDQIWKGLDTDVIDIGRFVVKLAPVSDGILERTDTAL
jgi:hypothetical protein